MSTARKKIDTYRKLAKAGIVVVDERFGKVLNMPAAAIRNVHLKPSDPRSLEYVKSHYEKFTPTQAEKQLKNLFGEKYVKLPASYSYYRVVEHDSTGAEKISRPYLVPYGVTKASRTRIQNAVKTVALRRSASGLKK